MFVIVNAEKHALFGRIFEISMRCYNVSNCKYYGIMYVSPDDNLLEKDY